MGEFKEILRELRIENNLTIKELSERCGYSKSVICYWEKGLRHPNAAAISVLAKFFNVSTDYLIGNEEPTRGEGISTLKLEPEEEELLRIYRNVSRGGKNILLGNARNIEKNDEYLKKQRRA